MEKNILTFLVLFILLSSGPSIALSSKTAGFASFRELYDNFLEYDKQKRGLDYNYGEVTEYLGYVNASASWFSFMVKITYNTEAYPDRVSIGQLGQIYGKYLEQNPEHHHFEARDCFINAMTEAFPLPKN